jgi:hypothetical protein
VLSESIYVQPLPWRINGLEQYLEELRNTYQINRSLLLDNNVIDKIAKYALNGNVKYIYLGMVNLYVSEIEQNIENLVHYIPLILSNVVMEYLGTKFALSQIILGLQLYLTCADRNIAKIILNCIFNPRYDRYKSLEIKSDFVIPSPRYPPKNCVFDGERLLIKNDAGIIKYSTNRIICIIHIDRPSEWAISVDDPFVRNVLVVTRNDTNETEIKTYVVDYMLFYTFGQLPLNTQNIFYGNFEHPEFYNNFL